MRYSIISLLLIVGVSATGTAAPSGPRTNVLLIMTDDQGVWSLGCYGNVEAHTPAVDRLASQGVRLTHENDGERARYCLPTEVLLSTLLAKGVYTCGLVGKWHLGESCKPHAGYTYWYAMPQGGSKYNDAEMYWQGAKIKTSGYLTDRITDRAIDFLATYKDRPFF